MALGDAIRRWRLGARLTQAQLAERMGVQRSTVERWEAEPGPPLETAWWIEGEFGLPKGSLAVAAGLIELSSERALVAAGCRGLSVAQRAAVLEIFDAFVALGDAGEAGVEAAG